MAINTANTKATLDALLKDVYGDALENLRPDFGVLVGKIPFRAAKTTGRDWVESVHLTHEHSVTYGAGLQTLQNIVPSIVDDAKVRGSAMTLRTAFSYDAAANMASSKGAFIDATKFKFQNLMESATYRLELQMLYGSSELGKVASIDNTAKTITISAATWAPGIWSAAEGALISVYDATGVTLRFSTAIVSVDAAAKTLTVSGGTTLTGSVAGDRIVFTGALNNEMVGLRSIAAAGTAAGPASLYGIGSAAYTMWQGNVFPVGAANLTLKKIYDGLVPAVGKGLMEDVVVLVSPATFSTMANDEAALRRYTAKTSKGDRGVDSIQFIGANGSIEVLIHPMVREQEAIAFPIKRAERIGASDLTMKVPGNNGDLFLNLPDQTGYESRLYSEQSIFLPCPAKCVLFTGVSNS
jgi:hypothetical protein